MPNFFKYMSYQLINVLLGFLEGINFFLIWKKPNLQVSFNRKVYNNITLHPYMNLKQFLPPKSRGVLPQKFLSQPFLGLHVTVLLEKGLLGINVGIF